MPNSNEQQPATRLQRVTKAAAISLTILVGSIFLAWLASRPDEPDPFYTFALPPSPQPGKLLRSEPFARDIPPASRAWRILYVTTHAGDAPAIASAIVVAPQGAGSAPSPVIAWAHGTTGIVAGCAPSLLAKPFANVPAFESITKEKWVYVATDYVGLGTEGRHAYLIGEEAARSVLDSVRAARQIDGLALDNRTVVWGHSQGGNSALWTGSLAPSYAPDVPLLGVAALAPASDLKPLVAAGQKTVFGKIVSSYLISAYAAAYPEVKPSVYLRARTRSLVNDIASRCVGGLESLFSVAESLLLPGDGIFSSNPSEGPLGERLSQNTPQDPIPAPVLIGQGEVDYLVAPSIQQRYVAARCAAGQKIGYHVYTGMDHLSLLGNDSPLPQALIEWTRARIAGEPAPSNCES